MPAFINKAQAQSIAGEGLTTLSTPALSITAGNFLLVYFRGGIGTSGSLISISDTAGNDFGAVLDSDGARMHMWHAANCLGHAANVVTATFPAQGFDELVVAQFSGMGAVVSRTLVAPVSTSGTFDISCLPYGPYSNQLAFVASDLANSGHSSIAGGSFTLLSSGTYGPGIGSDDIWYNINNTKYFDGTRTVTCTYFGGFETSIKTIMAVVFSPSPTLPAAQFDSSTPCCGSSGPGASGPVPAFDGPGWTPSCTGGGTVPSAADPALAELWDY